MRCPKCGTQAADNAAFCPKCDHILDPSLFLDDLAPEAPAEDTNPGVHLRQKASAAPSSRADTKPAGRRKPSRGSSRSSQKSSAEKSSASSLADSTGKSSSAPGSQSFPDRPQKSEFDEAEMLLSSLKADFLAQSPADKLMIVGALGMMLSCFFPWQRLERSGDVLGFLSLGALVIPLALASIAGMIWRKRTHEAFPLLPWLLQGLSGLLAVVYCLVLAKIFWVSKSAAELVGSNIENSTPSLGLFLGLLFALMNLAGTGMGLKRS